MKGRKRDKANVIIVQIIPVPVEEISEVFLARSSAIRFI